MITVERTKRECPVCRSSASCLYAVAAGTDILHGQKYRCLRCLECGLVYLDGRVVREAYSVLDSAEFYCRRTHVFHRFFDFYLAGLMRLRCRAMSRMFTSAGRVLDVGCAEGNFLKGMRRKGWQCSGADISSAALAVAGRALPGCRFFRGDILDNDFPAGSFDLITFWHSFEHFGDPAAVLAAASRLLAPGGLLFISVPNRLSIEARMCRSGWFGLELPRHQCTFTPASLQRLLAGQGLRVRSISMNSLEYSIPMFMLTFYNWLGLENNWLYNFLKRNSYVSDNVAYRLLTIVAVLALLPFVLMLNAGVFLAHSFTGNGSVIEVFAEKEHA